MATIGGRILNELVVSIDQRSHLIGFEKRSERVTVAKTNKRRRLGVQFRGMSGGSALTIGRVDPGSLGEQAGFLPGDVLLTVNDKSSAEYDMRALGALFGGSELLRIEVDRDGETKTVEIQ